MSATYTFTLTDGTELAELRALESNGVGNQSVLRHVQDVIFADPAFAIPTDAFVIPDDVSSRFVQGFRFAVTGNSAYDGEYEVSLGTHLAGSKVAVYSDGRTHIPVAGIPTIGSFQIAGVEPSVTAGAAKWHIFGLSNGKQVFLPGTQFDVTENSAPAANGTYTVLTTESSTAYQVLGVDAAANTWSVQGQVAKWFAPGVVFSINNSVKADAMYRVGSVVNNGNNTTTITIDTTYAATSDIVFDASIIVGTTIVRVEGLTIVTVTGTIPLGTVAGGMVQPHAPTAHYLRTSPSIVPGAPNEYTLIWPVIDPSGDVREALITGTPFHVRGAMYNDLPYDQVLTVDSQTHDGAFVAQNPAGITRIVTKIVDRSAAMPIIVTSRTVDVTAVNATTNYFQIAGDFTAAVAVGSTITVQGNTVATNGAHVVTSVALSGGNTRIFVTDVPVSATASGTVTIGAGVAKVTSIVYPLVAVPYGQVQYTVPNAASSLELVGKGAATYNQDTSWGQALQENMLHILENFSNVIPPAAPLKGQAWYNPAVPGLYIDTKEDTYEIFNVEPGVGTGAWIIPGNVTALPSFGAGKLVHVYNNTGMGDIAVTYLIVSTQNIGGTHTRVTVSKVAPTLSPVNDAIPVTATPNGVLYPHTNWHNVVITDTPVQGTVNMNDNKIINLGNATTTVLSMDALNVTTADSLYVAHTGGITGTRTGIMTGDLTMRTGANIQVENAGNINMKGSGNVDFNVGSTGKLYMRGTNGIEMLGTGNLHIATADMQIDTGNVAVTNGSVTVGTGNVAVTTGNLTTSSGLLRVGGSGATNKVELSSVSNAVPTLTFTTATTNNAVINLGTNRIVNLSNPVGAADAANKAYVDGLANGIIWLTPVLDPTLYDDTLTTPPIVNGTVPVSAAQLSIAYHKTYIVPTGATGNWSTLIGRAVQYVYDDATTSWKWVDILGRAVQAGDRFIVFGEPDQGDDLSVAGNLAKGGLAGNTGKIATIASVGPLTWSFSTPAEPYAVSVTGVSPGSPNPATTLVRSAYFGHSYTFRGTWGSGNYGTGYQWIQFNGPNALIDGAGLRYVGNILNIGQGTGITVDANEVSLDASYVDTHYVRRDGTVAMTAAFDAGAFRIVNVANATAATDAVNRQFGDTRYVTKATSSVLAAGINITFAGSGEVLGLPATPSGTGAATSKAYVDGLISSQTTAVGLKVSKAGDTMSGFLTLHANPTNAMHAATKDYVDTSALAKAGGTMTGAIVNPILQSHRETMVSASSGAAYAVNCASANVFLLTLTNNCVLSFTNIPSTGVSYSVTLALKQDGTGSRTVTWPAGVLWSGGTSPTLTTTADKTDFITLTTFTGGTDWYAFVGSKNH